MAVCILCNREATLTREHVLPQWVRYLPPGEGPFSTRRVSANGGAVEYTSTGIEIVARVVCGDCNGGWMAELEANVRPVLSPMINGRLQTMTPDQQLLIS